MPRNGTARKLQPPQERPGAHENRFTVYTTPELSDAIRDAVYTLSGPPHVLTISEFFIEAAQLHLERLRKTANGGRPWLKRPPGFQTRRGRPASK